MSTHTYACVHTHRHSDRQTHAHTQRRSWVVIISVLCFCGDACRGDLRHQKAASALCLQSLDSSVMSPQSRSSDTAVPELGRQPGTGAPLRLL